MSGAGQIEQANNAFVIASIPAEFWKVLAIMAVVWIVLAIGEGRHG